MEGIGGTTTSASAGGAVLFGNTYSCAVSLSKKNSPGASSSSRTFSTNLRAETEAPAE